MKINKIVGLSLAMMLGFGIVGCGNVENTNDLPNAEVEKPKVEEPKNVFDKYNILTFEEIEIDNTVEYSGDTFNDIKCKVTNNSNEMMYDVNVIFGLYDKEGVLLDTRSGFINESIQSNSSFYVDTSYDTTEYDVAEVKIISYDYSIDNNYYVVDLQRNVVEFYEYLN